MMVLATPCTLDQRPKAFNRISMNLTGFPRFAPLERLLFHFFTNLIIPAIRVGNELGTFSFDELLDKLKNRLSGNIRSYLCDDLSIALDCP